MCKEELTKCEVMALEEQTRLQTRLDGVLEDRAEAQTENARSMELLRSQCQELRNRLSAAEEDHAVVSRQVDDSKTREAEMVEKFSAEQISSQEKMKAVQRQLEETLVQLQEKEEVLLNEKKVNESMAGEMQKVKEDLLHREEETWNLRQQNDAIMESKVKFEEEQKAKELSLEELHHTRSLLDVELARLRQEKQDADTKTNSLEEKARDLEAMIQAADMTRCTAEGKLGKAEQEMLKMETQLQQLRLEARVHVTLAEEQQVVISEQREEIMKISRQLEEKQAVATTDPHDEEKVRLRECLAMTMDELDARQAQFMLDKQRLTGALEESRRAVLGYMGMSASGDSARVVGLEQQLASERNRCVQQAVAVQRMENQLLQQKQWKEDAEALQEKYKHQARRSQQLQEMVSEDLRKCNARLAVMELRAQEVQECACMALEELMTSKYESKFEVVRLRAALDELRSMLQKERLSIGSGYTFSR